MSASGFDLEATAEWGGTAVIGSFGFEATAAVAAVGNAGGFCF